MTTHSQHIIHTGQQSERNRARITNPAQLLADRLEAAGQHRDARIIRALLKSHSLQRGSLVDYGRRLRALHQQSRSA